MQVQEDADVNGRELLDRWVERGLIQKDQADRIRTAEGWEPRGRHRRPRHTLVAALPSMLRRPGSRESA